MRGIAPDKMTVEQLREAVSVMSRRGGGSMPPRLRQWSRKRCIDWLNSHAVPLASIGDFCRDLLRVVVGKTEEGYHVGLGYGKMKDIAQTHYPNSLVDEKHLRWYAHDMRDDGEIIPVYRERSKWK